MARNRKRYPGIRAFEEAEQRLFFGRKQEARDLYSLVKAKPSVVLFAKSGIGKSSLLNAGLVPLLENNLYEPIKVRLQNRSISPAENIKSALAQYLDEDKLKKHANTDAKSARLWEYIRSCTFPNPEDEEEIVPVIIFDQFEEFFDHPAEQQEILIEELSDLLSDRLPERIQEQLRKTPRRQRTKEQLDWHSPLMIKVIFAIRSDRLSLMDDMSHRIPMILHNRFHLKPLGAEQAKEAIVEPAKIIDPQFEVAPFGYDDTTLQSIISHLSNKHGEIESFQLQLVCQHIEKKVKEKATENFTVKADLYGGERGLRSILNDYYENEMEELTPEEQPIAKRFIEEGLIVGGKRVGVTEGVEKEHYQVNEVLLSKLLESRLIRVENTHLGKSFEVSHDAMVAPIVASYEKRRLIEEKAAKAAELRKARKQFLLAASIALVGFILAAIAILFYLKAEQALAELKEKQKQNAIERSERFIATGNNYRTNTDYVNAIKEFESAKEAIEEYNQLLDKAEALDPIIFANFQKADSLIEISKNSKESKKKFDDLMKKGNEFRMNKDYLSARFAFEEAKQYDTRGIAEIEYNKNENDLDKEYNQLIESARALYRVKEKFAYADAFNDYQKAAKIKPLSTEDQRKFKICEQNK